MREKEPRFQYDRRSQGLGRLAILRFGSPDRGIRHQEQGVSILGLARQNVALSRCCGADAFVNGSGFLAGRFRRMRRKNRTHPTESQAQDDCHTDQNFENPMIHVRPQPRNDDDTSVSLNIPPIKDKRFFDLWFLLSAVPPVR
jgi:hypothetical protein